MSEGQHDPVRQPTGVDEPGTQGGSGQPPSKATQVDQPGRWPWSRLVIPLVVVALALFLCALWLKIAPGAQVPGLNCGALVQPGASESAQAAVTAEAAAELTYLADDHVILTGFQSAIDTVTSELAEQGIRLEVVRDCELGAFEPSPGLGLVPRPAVPWQIDLLKINLYRIASGQSVIQVISAVEAVVDPATGEPVAHADPNYKTVGGAAGPCGSPDNIGGSPDNIGGSPDNIGGSPAGPPGKLTEADVKRLYWEQWALEHIGLGSTPIYGTGIASIAYTGDGVRVGVFDTAPFATSGEGAESQAGRVSRQQVIDWVSPTLTVTVEDNSAYRTNLAFPSAAGADPNEIKQHGLFVAGLIHAIAPGSDIRLYQVLNDAGCGDLYSLIAALNRFTAQAERDRRVLGLRGAVANLSLGVLKPMSETDTSGQFALTQDICDQMGLPDEPCRQLLEALVRDRIEALQVTVEWAHKNGIVVVAAAGNGSGRDGRPVRPPDLPAAYPTVLGVAGSNVNRLRACFSNWGDLFAPGGDGGPQETPEGTYTCGNALGQCDEKGNCANRVVSLVLTDTFPLTDTFGYAYWKGTSFSTPLVSGLATLITEAGTRKTGYMPRRLSADEVSWAIHCGSSLGDGIINVPATLALCVRP